MRRKRLSKSRTLAFGVIGLALVMVAAAYASIIGEPLRGKVVFQQSCSLCHGTDAKGTGYLIGTAIFGVIFVAAVLVQIKAKKFHPFLYWLTIVATTTVGTTLADFADRSLGIGYTGGSLLLLGCLLATLGLWRWSQGTVSVSTVFARRPLRELLPSRPAGSCLP